MTDPTPNQSSDLLTGGTPPLGLASLPSAPSTAGSPCRPAQHSSETTLNGLQKQPHKLPEANHVRGTFFFCKVVLTAPTGPSGASGMQARAGPGSAHLRGTETFKVFSPISFQMN